MYHPLLRRALNLFCCIKSYGPRRLIYSEYKVRCLIRVFGRLDDALIACNFEM